MTVTDKTPPSLTQVWQAASKLNTQERIMLARQLLDSVLSTESNDELDWQQLSLSAFEAEWDNPEDAVYDNWREYYGVSAR